MSAASASAASTPSPQQGAAAGNPRATGQRGRPTEDPLPKFEKLALEFQQAGAEHPRFCGQERKTQTKAFDRLFSALQEDIDLTDENPESKDAAKELELRVAKKKLEVIKSICAGYLKGNGYVVAYREAESYSKIAPKIDLDFIPVWLMQERFRLDIAISKSSEFWDKLTPTLLQQAGYDEDQLESTVISVVADRIVETCRREPFQTLAGYQDPKKGSP